MARGEGRRRPSGTYGGTRSGKDARGTTGGSASGRRNNPAGGAGRKDGAGAERERGRVERMRERDIADFLKREVEPVRGTAFERAVYRASVGLGDGTELPCVAFSSASERTGLAIRRIGEERERRERRAGEAAAGIGPAGEGEGHDPYRSIVKNFVAGGGRVAPYDVAEVRKSPHAIPAELYEVLRGAGETAMGYQAFWGTMDDGAEFLFGTTYELVFFSTPEGYAADRLVSVRPLKRDDYPWPGPESSVWRAMCRFDCYRRRSELMGLSDDIVRECPLPESGYVVPGGHVFRTRSFENLRDRYTITEDGA